MCPEVLSLLVIQLYQVIQLWLSFTNLSLKEYVSSAYVDCRSVGKPGWSNKNLLRFRRDSSLTPPGLFYWPGLFGEGLGNFLFYPTIGSHLQSHNRGKERVFVYCRLFLEGVLSPKYWLFAVGPSAGSQSSHLFLQFSKYFGFHGGWYSKLISKYFLFHGN